MNGEVMLSPTTGTDAALDTTNPQPQQRRYQRGSLALKHGAWYAVIEASTTSTSGGSRRKQWVRLGSKQQWPRKSDALPHFVRFMQLLNEELGTTDNSPRLTTFIDKKYLPSLKLAPSTIAGYRDCYRHLETRLGDHTLAGLQAGRCVRVAGEDRRRVQHVEDNSATHLRPFCRRSSTLPAIIASSTVPIR